MKKRRYLIPICLFVGAALLVGGFFLVRWWLRPEVWVTVPLDNFVLTNDRGETLQPDADDNTLTYTESRTGFQGYSLRVRSSDVFTLQTDSQEEVCFAVQWDDECTFTSFRGYGATRLSISRDCITVEGELRDFLITTFTEEDSTRRYRLRGDAAEWVRLERSEREATAESSSSYTLELRDLYSEEVFAQHESSDGAAFTLQNVSGN